MPKSAEFFICSAVCIQHEISCTKHPGSVIYNNNAYCSSCISDKEVSYNNVDTGVDKVERKLSQGLGKKVRTYPCNSVLVFPPELVKVLKID